jgi:adenosine deaminase
VRDPRNLPKADLHVHIEGSMRPATLVELADRHGLALPANFDGQRYRFTDFAQFIETWIAITSCLREPDDLQRLAYEFCEDQAREGVHYTEAHFSLPRQGGLDGDYETRLLATLDGLRAGRDAFGIEARLILDLVRGLSMDASSAVADCAVRLADPGVVGFGLGGPEQFGPEPYRRLFDLGRDAGLHCVVHAGETEGPESIRAALAVGAERIGHGINATDDAGLVALLGDRAVPLEVCPTSNVQTASVASLAVHPLPALVEAGLVVTLNSDDPAMFSSPLTGEYELCRDAFGFDDATLAAIARAGVHASFADAATRQPILDGIDAWLTAPA